MTDELMLSILKAEELPRSRDKIRQNITACISRALAITSCISPDSSDSEALTYMHKALDIIAINATTSTYNQQEKAKLPFDRYEEHDDFFRVVRVSGNPLSILIHSIIKAYYLLLEDSIAAGVTLNKSEWQRLRMSFEAMLAYLRETIFDTCDKPDLRLETQTVAKRALDPLRRWRLGHQVFSSLIQSLIVILNCFGHAFNANNLQDAYAALELATCLMWGSASALRFAGDFQPVSYERIVRPAMMPPNLEPGFSGLQIRDHRYLLKILQELKPIFAKMDDHLYNRHRQFSQAMEATYEAHKFVCGRFKGCEEPSLRMNANAKMSSVDALDQLKHSRLRSVKQR